jgi:hypothetical protein
MSPAETGVDYMALRNRRCLILLWIGLLVSVAQPKLSFAQQDSGTRLSKALNQLDGYVKDAMVKTKVPGVSVAVVFQDRVVF